MQLWSSYTKWEHYTSMARDNTKSSKSPSNLLSHMLLQTLYCWVNSHLRCCRPDVAHQVFHRVLQVNFLSSLPHVKDSTAANSIADDVAGLLPTSIV